MKDLTQGSEIVKWLQSADFQVNRWLTIVVSTLLFLVMLLIVCDVAGRYLLNKPVQGTLEISEVVLVLIVFGALTYYEMVRGHIRMTLFTSHLSPKGQLWCDIFVSAIAVVFCALMTWQTFDSALFAWRLKETFTGAGMVAKHMPIGIPKFAVFLGFLLFSIHFLGSLSLKIINLGRFRGSTC